MTVEGYKVHGSPWQPTYGAGGGAFQIPRDGEEARAVAGGIPADTDVLVTHGPPHGYQVLQCEPVCFSGTRQNFHINVRFNSFDIIPPAFMYAFVILKQNVQDVMADGNHGGCKMLREAVEERIKPSYHVFGHIHEGKQITTTK